MTKDGPTRPASKTRPTLPVYPKIVARPGKFRAEPGQLAVIIDEPGWPLVAIQTPAHAVPLILRAFDRSVTIRGHRYRDVVSGLFTACHGWCDNAPSPVPRVPDNIAYASGLAAVFWVAFRDPPEAPGRGQILQAVVDGQLADHGAAAVTLAILDVPTITQMSGRAPQTRRWITHPDGLPVYVDHRTADAGLRLSGVVDALGTG